MTSSDASRALDALSPDTSRRDAMRLLAGAFTRAGIDDPAVDARLLLCAAAGFDHSALIRDPDLPVEDAADRLHDFAQRRLAREPVSRILGERSFWSFDLLVTSAVLDPRPDTETVVDAALEALASRQAEALAILDLGTGSGALLCALLDVFPNARGVGVDISSAACAVARENLARCDLAGRATILCGDWDAAGDARFDLVVSNPPYIPTGDLVGLDPEVRLFDPALALDGGPDGFTAYRRIAALLPRLLQPDGMAALEAGVGQAEGIAALLREAGLVRPWRRADLSGIDRAICAWQPPAGA